MIFLIILLVFELFLVHKILRYFLLSPIYLYLLFGLTSIIITVWYFYFFQNKFSLYNLDVVSEEVFLGVIKLYILALNSFLLGVLFYYEVSKKKTKIIFNKSFSERLFIKYKLRDSFNNIAAGIFFIIIILYFITYGKGLFIRTDYLPNSNRVLTIFLKVLTFIEIILLGLIYNKKNLLSTTLFLLTILVSISTGSRSVFLFYIVYVCLIFISSGNSLFNKLRFLFHVFIGFIFLAYIMQLRGLDSHGLIPYIKSIGSPTDFLRNVFFNVYYSFIYGVYVTIETINKAKLDWSIILININPLPGSIAGWYDYADNMRINFYVPYSLHGRVFKTGLFFSVIYFFITGLLFSYFESVVRKMFMDKNRILAFLIIILLVLHIVYAFEYNMRSAIRYFYYAFFILLMRYLYVQIKKNLPKLK
jgi:hypothetical protein